jgi:hypothetical protein
MEKLGSVTINNGDIDNEMGLNTEQRMKLLAEDWHIHSTVYEGANCINVPFAVLPSSTYLFTAGVEGFDFSLDHTQTHTTVGRTPLDEGSARRRDLYMTT